MALKIIYTTVPNKKEAEYIAKTLLEADLAVCANIIEKSTSFYRWKGKIQKETESIIFIKTKASLAKNAIEAIEALHSYECPFIASIALEKINKDYEKWANIELSDY